MKVSEEERYLLGTLRGLIRTKGTNSLEVLGINLKEIAYDDTLGAAIGVSCAYLIRDIQEGIR